MVEELEILLPPLAEQRRIAELLDRAEELRVKRRAALAQLELPHPIPFSRPEYLRDGNHGLPVVWVEELFRSDAIDTKHSRRVVPVGREVEKYGLKKGDILFCRSSLKLDGIAFNNVYVGEDDATLFECHLIRLSPNLKLIVPVFLNCLLRLPQMRAIAKSKSRTATMTTIDQQSLCSIDVPAPPSNCSANSPAGCRRRRS